MDDAGAALRCIAADMGAGQAEPLAQKVDQEHMRRHISRHAAAIHLQKQFRHTSFLPVRAVIVM